MKTTKRRYSLVIRYRGKELRRFFRIIDEPSDATAERFAHGIASDDLGRPIDHALVTWEFVDEGEEK